MSYAKGSFADITLSLLRAVAGFLFLQHGAQKLFAVLGREETVELFSLMGLAGVLEFFGGLIILLGIYTRPVAFVLSGEMAVAYFMSHFPRNFWPIENGGELAALYCFVFLFLCAVGGGSYSVDGMLLGGGKSSD
jgi:putative oxidoreductase